ncbi:hypothetical protein R3P38DRAFT_2813749 [Favolaschia claudopus]|uniref:Uncharacterized protein n=1 Tax=Favolaschia claudopus TaxID=2862362 RepID=A0AAV9Z4H9_9AGAR
MALLVFPCALVLFPTFLGEFRASSVRLVSCRVLSAKLGVLGTLVVITRIKSGNLVLPGERRYNISAEESKDTLPPYQNLESPPPYNGARHVEFTRPTNILTSGTPEVAGPLDQDICSASGTSTQPTQQRGREAGRQYELQLDTFPSHPMHRPHVAAAASSAVPGRITSSSSRTNGPVPRTKIVGLKSLIASSAELGCVENVQNVTAHLQGLALAGWRATTRPSCPIVHPIGRHGDYEPLLGRRDVSWLRASKNTAAMESAPKLLAGTEYFSLRVC